MLFSCAQAPCLPFPSLRPHHPFPPHCCVLFFLSNSPCGRTIYSIDPGGAYRALMYLGDSCSWCVILEPTFAFSGAPLRYRCVGHLASMRIWGPGFRFAQRFFRSSPGDSFTTARSPRSLGPRTGCTPRSTSTVLSLKAPRGFQGLGLRV